MSFSDRTKAWIDAALGFVYPEVCQICAVQRATLKEGFVCGACWARPNGVRFVTPPFCDRCGLPYAGAITEEFVCGNCHDQRLYFQSARASVAATGLILDVVHRYKYRGQLWFEPFLFDLLLRRAVPVLAEEHWDLIVPVPLHPLRRREREFNQAERLAERLGKACGLPVEHRMLQRVEHTTTQTVLTRAERNANVAKAFEFTGSSEVSGLKVVLVDDILTTGATTNACAKTLRRNGAEKVCVWTVARGLQTR